MQSTNLWLWCRQGKVAAPVHETGWMAEKIGGAELKENWKSSCHLELWQVRRLAIREAGLHKCSGQKYVPSLYHLPVSATASASQAWRQQWQSNVDLLSRPLTTTSSSGSRRHIWQARASAKVSPFRFGFTFRLRPYMLNSSFKYVNILRQDTIFFFFL